MAELQPQREPERFNMEKPVLLTIKYEGEVFTADEVANLLKAYTDQYSRYIDDELLIINDIKKGSLEISLQEILNYIGAAAPIIAENGIYKLYQDLKTAFDLFRERLPTKEEAINNNITQQKCNNVANILQPVSKDNSNQLNLSVVNDNSIHVHLNVNGNQASTMINRVKEMKKILAEKTSFTLQNEPFRYHQIRKSIKTGTGDRIFVESISNKPLKVKYDNVSIKEDIVESNENTFNFIFFANMTVQLKEDLPDTIIINELSDQMTINEFTQTQT